MSFRLTRGERSAIPMDSVPDDLATAKLGPRLATLASWLTGAKSFADIGTDHGRLPVAAVLTGRVERAIAIDVHESALARATALVARFEAADRVDVRLGDGLSCLADGEVDTVVLAGVGSATVRDVLTPEAVARVGVRRVLVQPETEPAELRAVLARIGFAITQEALVRDAYRGFVLIEASRVDGSVTLSDDARLMGAFDRRTPLAKAYFRHRANFLSSIEDKDSDTVLELRALSAEGSA